MTQKILISSFLPFSFGVALALPFIPVSAFSAPTTTLPIEAHPLKALDLPAPPPGPVRSETPAPSSEKKKSPPPGILSFSAKPSPAPQKETILPAPVKTAPVVQKPEIVELPPAPAEDADLQELRQIKEEVSATTPIAPAVQPTRTAQKHKGKSKPVTKSKPAPKVHPKPLSKPVPKATSKIVPVSALKPLPPVPSQMTGTNPDLFELGGVHLGMSFSQARTAMAANLGIKLTQVEVSGTPPEPQTCTDTQLNAEGPNGTINVQFTCNEGLPLHHELSVNHISYEPATGMIETILNRAVKKYGNPVNLSEYDPLQADYVSYDWCAHPVKNISSEGGKFLYCPAKNESRLRLQGRDNSLEFELAGLIGAAKYYQGESDIPALGDDSDAE